jgi:predicted nucleotide-binding protein
MDRKTKDIGILNDFKITLQVWNLNRLQVDRSKINQLLPKVRNILNETKSNKYVNIDAPLAMGGQHIVQGCNCLDFIFDAPFNLDVTPYVYDAIDSAIGVLSDDEFEYPIKQHENMMIADTPQNQLTVDSKAVFIVHGHDTNVRNEVELFIRSIGYEPIILCKRADKGNTIIEKIEHEAKNVCFAIVIYTSCDLGKDKNADKLQPRARQNVVFEHGFICAHLGRERVCALLEVGVEQPGDLQGVIYKPLDVAGIWRYQIADEMKAVGLDVDKNLIK